MSSDLLIPFGLSPAGRMVPPSEVDRGAACDCVCPSCHHPLIAKQGDVLAWHFAHASDQSCEGALETSLHRFAKQALCDAQKVWLPAAYHHAPGHPVLVGSACMFHTKNVKAEESRGSFKPDVVFTTPGITVGVEIWVAHKVPPEKAEKLRQARFDTIEIDLRKLPRQVDADAVTAAVIKEAPRHWVYHWPTERESAAWHLQPEAA